MAIRIVGKRFAGYLALFALTVAPALAQAPDVSNPPQTARQALLEMLFSKTPGTFAKHLPAATLAALDKSGALATLQQYSALAAQFQTKGKTFETFETGHVLLAAEDAPSGQRFEMNVVHCFFYNGHFVALFFNNFIRFFLCV